MIKRYSMVLILLITGISANAFAAENVAVAPAAMIPSTSRVGAEVQAIKTPSGLGILYGSQYVAFHSENFFIGGAAYTGQLSSNSSSFSYGGLVAGYNWALKPSLGLSISLLLGGGGGSIDATTAGGGTVLRPGLAFDFSTGKTVRTTFSVGYLYMPSNASFTGVMGGLRFDFLM